MNYKERKTFLERFYDQSYLSKNTPQIEESIDHDIHQDGIGFAVFNGHKWTCIKSPVMDKAIIHHHLLINGDLIIGHLRYKGHCSGNICYENTHPFCYEQYVFVHNGFIEEFDRNRDFLLSYIDKKYYDHIRGETDSEIIFFLLLTFLDSQIDCTIKNVFQFLQALFHQKRILYRGNFILANERFVVITRLSNFQDTYYYSLYKNQDSVSSEPMSSYFELFREDSIFIYKIDTKQIQILNMDDEFF
jgi:predicted glutamine amidotransferase